MTTDQGEGRRMRRTTAELGARREALEAAGREEWERATREGRDVRARTPQELRELGARALARKAGKAGGLDEAFMAGRGDPNRIAVTAAQADEDELVRPENQVAFEPTLNERVERSPGKRVYSRIAAEWDPSRSSDAWNLPSDALFDAGDRYRMSYDPKSPKEKIAFFVPDGAGGHTLEDPPGKTRTRSSANGDSARAPVRRDADAAIHWHLDRDSKGYVDDPDNPADRQAKGYGDTGYLRFGKPIATVFKGEVGWHGLENGRLIFLYPSGTMSQEIDAMQQNLNREQKMFYRRK